MPVKGNMSSSSLPKSTPDPVCVGLCEKWDEDDTIREKLRGGEPLVPEGTGTDGIRAAVSIKSTLMPLLARMAEAENKLPEVEALREEIQKLYVKNKQCRPASDVEADSWTLRKLCTFVKKKCRRVEVSLDTDFQALVLTLAPHLEEVVAEVNSRNSRNEEEEEPNEDEDDYDETTVPGAAEATPEAAEPSPAEPPVEPRPDQSSEAAEAAPASSGAVSERLAAANDLLKQIRDKKQELEKEQATGLSSSVAAAAGDFTDTQPVDVMALPVPADRSPKHMSPETSEEKRKKFQIKILRTETAELPGDHPMPTPESAEATEAQPPTVPAKETSTMESPGDNGEDHTVLGREDQLRNKKTKKTKNGKTGKTGKGKKSKTPDKPKAKPGAKARKLLRSTKKKKEQSDLDDTHAPEADVGAATPPAPKAKAKAKAKAKSSPKRKAKAAEAVCKKPAANDKHEPPKKRIRHKTSQQEQWELDEQFYDEELYEAIQEYVYKFNTDDAGNQFKKKVKYNLNFQMLHCSIDPYYSRQCCVTKAPKEITADGKETSWCFSFHGDSEKGGPYWQFEMACSIICAHLLAQQVDYVVEQMNEKLTKDHAKLTNLPQQLRYNGNAVMYEIKKDVD